MTTDVQAAEGLLEKAEPPAHGWLAEPRFYVRAISLVMVIGSWELLGWGGVIRTATFSYPSAIVRAFIELLVSGEMLHAAYESSQIFAAGLGIAIPAGIAIGILMGRSRTFEYAVDTYVYALYATPVVALAFPIAMLLGVDFLGKTSGRQGPITSTGSSSPRPRSLRVGAMPMCASRRR